MRIPPSFPRRLGSLQGGKAHAWAAAAMLLAYSVAFLWFVPRTGTNVGAALIFPVALAGWWFGPRGGVITGLAAAALSLGMNAAQGGSFSETLARVGFGNAALLVVGAASGAVALAFHDKERQRVALLEAEATARTLAEATFEGIAIHENGVIRRVNKSFARLFGYEPEELIGMDAHQLLDPAGHPVLEEHLRTRQETPYVLTGLTKQKRKILIEIQARDCTFEGRPARVAAVRDITDRLAAEKALRASEERFRTLFENATIGLYRTTPDGRVLLANPALLRMLGYDSLAELSRRDLNEGDGASIATYSRAQWMQRLKEEGHIRAWDTQWRRKDGTIIPVRESARAIFGPDGQVLHFEGTVEDMTEIKRLEQERVAQVEAVARSERLSSLGTLVAGVAHEINNPLTYIAGNIELALMDVREAATADPNVPRPDFEATARGLEQALAGAERIGSITRALKAVARRRSANERETVDLNLVLKDAGALLQVGVPDGIELDVCTAPEPVHVHANVAELHQVILNLARNAVEALTERGRGHVRISASQAGKVVTIRVQDDGPGIPPEVMAKLFTPFFTTKISGTGLGLSIVHGIVRDHKGDVTVTSDPRAGTTFSIHLPAAEAAEAANRSVKPSGPRAEEAPLGRRGSPGSS